jgi:hypothetical protein
VGCTGRSPGASSSTSAAASPVPAIVINRAPGITVDAPQYARAGVPFMFQPVAEDADGDALTFSANNLPPWASLDAVSGRITGTPSAGDVGAYESIVITVADAAHRTEASAFDLTVLPPATGTASLRWETPASKVDGSPLDDLAGYRILYGRSAEDLDQSVFVDDAAATSYEITALDSGIWYFTVVAVSSNGLEGPASTTAMKSI